MITLAWFPYYAWCDKHLKSIRGPTPLPFIGTFRHFFAVPTIFFQFFKELFETYGKTFKAYILTEQTLITMDTEFIEFIATRSQAINKSRAYSYLHNWLGQGLLTSSGQKWRSRRKMITPAYHFKVLDQFLEVFERNGNIMIEKLSQEVGNYQTDIFPYINLCALDTICETSMGTQVNAQINKESAFVQSTKKMNRIMVSRTFSLLKTFDATYAYTKDYQIEKDALKVLHGYTMSVIKSRREELANRQMKDTSKDAHDDQIGNKRKDNFLDILLKSTVDGALLSDEDIREEVDTFTFEGHDTVSSGMSFALYAISNHPEIQQRLIEEQRSIFGNNPKRATTLNDISEMKYLEMVIKEAMRLYPPVPFMGREISENVAYKDMQLRKGVQIMIFVFELHRDASNFPDPLRFDPDRFLPENQVGRHPYAYIPFSAGHRNCIGQKFAMLEMKCTVAKVLRNYELMPLTPKHEPMYLPEVILRSENGVLLNLKLRHW